MNVREVVLFVRRFRVLLVIGILTGVIGGAGYCLFKTPTYAAESTVFVSTSAASSVSDLSAGSTFSQQIVKSYAAVVSTPYVVAPVIKQLNLRESSSQLAMRISATAPLDTTEIIIEVRDSNAVRAARIANALTERLTSAVSDLSPTTTLDQANGASVRLTQIQSALPPSSPASPNWPLTITIAAFAGLVLCILIALARLTLDTRVHGPSDLAHTVDLPLLGFTLYDSEMRLPARPSAGLSSTANDEAFRSLRTQLQYLDLPASGSSILITSSIESEGKSSVTVGLARSIAAAGKTVVLVDADLRRPRLASVLGLEGGFGLSEVLSGQASVEEATQEWGNATFHCIPSGAIPPNPSELLQSSRTTALISELSKQFDYVLLDAPPVLPVADATVLSRQVTGCLFVCATERTKRQQLLAATNVLSQVGAPILGLVLTMVRTNSKSDAYNYSYYGTGSAAARTTS